MTPDQHARLVEALHEHAVGITAQVAAVDLLTNHRVWLPRADFAPFIQHRRCHSTGEPMAMIRWRAAVTALGQARLPCSSAEADMLRIAASLGCLDHRNIAHVVRAIGIANDTWPLSTEDIR
jgi:hypothetical protein